MGATTVADVRAARPDELARLSASIATELHRLEAVRAWLSRGAGRVGDWVGPASSASATNRAEIDRAAAAAIELLTGLRWRVDRTFESVLRARGLVARADGCAHLVGGHVTPAGELAAPPMCLADPAADLDLRRRVQEQARLVRELTRDAVTVYDEADQALSVALNAVAANLPIASAPPPVVAPPLPPDGASAAAVGSWWVALSAQEQDLLVATAPEWVGARDGLPVGVRHRANVVLLARAIAREAGPAGDPQRRAQLLDLQALLSQRDGVTRHLAVFSTEDSLVQAAVTQGNVDSAAHVGVFVPGMTTTLDDMRRYDEDMRDVQAYLRAHPASTAPGDERDSVASVVWIGYHAPQFSDTFGGDSFLFDGAARRGADALAPFVEGLFAARSGKVDLSILAHSYGTVTTGFALTQSKVTNRVAVFGGPGTSGSLHSPADVWLKPDAVNVLEAVTDPIPYIGSVPSWAIMALVSSVTKVPVPPPPGGVGHAPGWRSIGGQRLSTRGAKGHLAYFDKDTLSQRNIAAVLADRAELEVPEPQKYHSRRARPH